MKTQMPGSPVRVTLDGHRDLGLELEARGCAGPDPTVRLQPLPEVCAAQGDEGTGLCAALAMRSARPANDF
jgi:hypothetical protein